VHLSNAEILMLIVVVMVVMVVAAVVQGSSIVCVYGIYIHPGRDKTRCLRLPPDMSSYIN
jgi:hypothetical protein